MSDEQIPQDASQSETTTNESPYYRTSPQPDDGATWLPIAEMFGVVVLVMGTLIAANNGQFSGRTTGATRSARAEAEAKAQLIEQAIQKDLAAAATDETDGNVGRE